MTALIRYRFVVLALVGAGLVAGAVWSERSRRAALSTTSTGKQVVTRGKLGPTPGPDAEGYIAEKKAYLSRAASRSGDTRAAALVSLSRFLAPAETASLTAGARLDFLFVRYPTQEAEALPVSGTVEVTMGSAAQRKAADLEAEVAQLESLARTSAPSDRDRHLTEAATKRAHANEIRRGCACIYAIVLSDLDLGDLGALQGRAEVRLVDVPDPVVADLRGWELTPIAPKT